MQLSYKADLEVQKYSEEITLSSGIKFDHRDTLKKINCHKAGKFYNNDDDDIFWPLGQQRAPHFAKKLDVDTRHFQVEGRGDYNAFQAWATNVRFKKWAKDTGLALDLDDFGDAAGDFGSCAIKLVERKEGGYNLEECNLMMLWFDPTIKYFYGQTKIELHELEQHEILNKKGWLNTRLAWEAAEIIDNEETEKTVDSLNQVAEKRKFWERVGYFNVSYYENQDLVNGKYLENVKEQVVEGKKTLVKEDLRENKEDVWKFIHTIHSGQGSDEVIVFAEEIKLEDDIYQDIHIGKYENRWLRIGVYERLFRLQKLINEVVNYNKESQQISSLLLMRSKNKRIIGSSILDMAKSGLITDTDIEQIGINNQFFNEFISTISMYERKADSLCMTPDVLTGEGSDVKTFRGQAALTNMANSAFKKSRDRICFKVSDILVNKILPNEVKNWSKEKTLEIAGFDIDVRIYDATKTIYELNKYISDEFAKGNNPTPDEQAVFISKIQETIGREGRRLRFNEGFFDFDFGLSINASGETENKEQMNDVYFNVINWILANPIVFTIPAFRDYCVKNGLTPFHLTPSQVQQIQQGATPQAQVMGEKRDKLSASIDTTE